MRNWVDVWFAGQWVLVVALLSSPLWASDAAPRSGHAMRSFSSAAELERFRATVVQQYDVAEEAAADAAAPAESLAPAAINMSPVPELAAKDDTITNVQTEGVDEGGIVKRSGDFLVILRRGRLFTVSTADSKLRAVDRINAFPGVTNGREAWYDEMLVSGDMVVVIGFNYARQGTEISRFRLGRDGSLTYRDTHNIRSADYYSDRNYASRLIGTRLIIYAPLPMGYGRALADDLPAIAEWAPDSQRQRFVPYADHGDIYLPDPWWGKANDGLAVLHTVSTCDLVADDLDCEATAVLGSWSRSFYVSADAVYVWSGIPYTEEDNAAMLFRLPLDGSAPQAIKVAGNPIDQFSFREGDGHLDVLTQSFGGGDAMMASEDSDAAELALLHLPLAAFGSGSDVASADAYRVLPAINGWGVQNRFVGDHLVYGVNGHGSDRTGAEPAYAVPLGGGDPVRLQPGHAVSRIDRIGNDAVLIGQARDGALSFSSVRLEGTAASIVDRYLVAGASEGENRSHAFFYRPDSGSTDGASGMLGLPVSRERYGSDLRFLGSSGSILFLRRGNRSLSLAGELTSEVRSDDDNCLASCVDWYGNARPIFIGSRIFALLGYELVEGAMSDGRIRELRRVDFTPRRRDLRRAPGQTEE